MANDRYNGVDLYSTFRMIPGQADNSNISITGAWSLPARKGKTFHDWGNVPNNIEPYVSAEEMFFAGRDIDYVVLLEASSELEALKTCYSFYSLLDGINTPAPLITEYGTWNVSIRGEIVVEYLGDGWCKLKIPFREPVVDVSGILPKPSPDFLQLLDSNGQPIYVNNSPLHVGSINYDGFGIDGVMFRDMNLIILSINGRFNRPAPKEFQVTAYRNEGFRVTKTSLRELTVKALIVRSTFQEFSEAVKSLYALFTKPGLRYLTYENDILRDFFVKDGFTVTDVLNCENECLGVFNIKLSEVKAYADWSILTDFNNNEIVTDLGNIIIT